jgi:ATP-binding cassette, subfamily B, bacterial
MDSRPVNIRRQLITLADAFRLNYEADRRSFLVSLGLPVVLGLSRVGQLIVLKQLAVVFLDPQATSGAQAEHVAPWLGVAILVSAIGLVTQNLMELSREVLTDRVANLSAVRMHKAVASLTLIEFDQPEINDRISRAEQTANYRPGQIVRSTTMLSVSLITLFFIIGWLTYLQPLLLPMFVLASVPVIGISNKVAKSRFKFLGKMTPLERKRRYLGRLLVGKQAAAEIRSFNTESYLTERYEEFSRQRLAELKHLLREQWRSMIVGQIAYTLMLSTGIGVMALLYFTGRLSPVAVLTAAYGMFQVVTLLGGLGYPLRELTESNLFLQDQREFFAQIAAAGVGDVNGVDPGPLRELSLRDVSFRYPGSPAPALRGINMTIRSGQMVAFVGPNGSGKTTLSKILALLYTPSSGVGQWNGVDFDAINYVATRDHISVVFQDFVTYQLPVTENVHLGDVAKPPGDGLVDQALQAAGAQEMVARLAQGKHTQLGPEFIGGTSLSGGQAQRLALARAFYRDRELLILDEPTSGLDAKSDSQLMATIKSLLHGRTAIVVSHRFSNVKEADQIFVFSEGEIVESGTHYELMRDAGLYAEMYCLQAEPYLDEHEQRVSPENIPV